MRLLHQRITLCLLLVLNISLLVFSLSDIITPQSIGRSASTHTLSPPGSGAFATGTYRDLFVEIGKSDPEIQDKLNTAWQQLFYGNDENQRIYYPVGSNMAYIKDVGDGDVRTEGISYGMMISLQMNKQEEFNRLWTWAKTYMYHAYGDNQGYFAWQCSTSGQILDAHAAPDGDQWFAMALFFAAGRWGNGSGIYNYQAEAQRILHTMLHHGTANSVTHMFDQSQKQVVFVPYSNSATYTDPSYHLPAFYELWSRWASEDRQFWTDAAVSSRTLLKRAVNPTTGLAPDYADFNGQPRNDGGHGDFRFDAWRVASNIAVDYAWFAPDPWEKAQSDRLQRFFMRKGITTYANQYALDGTALSTDHSPGLVAMNAVASLATTGNQGGDFVNELWDAKVPEGRWRYYDGMLYMLGLLHASGNFRIYAPSGSGTEAPPATTVQTSAPTDQPRSATTPIVKVSATSGSGGQIKIEAEAGTNKPSGGASIVDCVTCSGGKKVTGIGKGGTLLFDSFQVSQGGTYTITIRYFNGDQSSRKLAVSINHGTAQMVDAPALKDIGTVSIKANLQGGYNSIDLSNAQGIGPDIDSIIITAS